MGAITVLAAVAAGTLFLAPAASAATNTAPSGCLSSGDYSGSSGVTATQTNWATIKPRVDSWVGPSYAYSTSCWVTNKYGKYRTDCSGFVSMAWGLSDTESSHTLNPGDPAFADLTHQISWAAIQPGDALVVDAAGGGDPHHIALVIAFNPATQSGTVAEESEPGVGTITASFSSASSYWSQFTPIRYDRFTPATANPPTVPASGRLSTVLKSDGTENVFWRGSGGQLYNDYFRPGLPGWIGPQQIGSGLKSDPSAIALPGGGMDVFYSTGSSSLQHSYFKPGSGWVANSPVPTPSVVGTPSAVLKSDGTENVFWRGSGGQLYNSYFRTGLPGWTAAQQIGSSLKSDPEGLALTGGGMDVFYSTGPSAPTHSYFNSAGWHANSALPAASIVGTPSTVLKSDGTENVFFRGSSGQLLNEYFRPGLPGWTAAAQIGSGLKSDPGALALTGGGMDVFYSTGAANVAHSYFETGIGWKVNSALPSTTITGTPAALETSKSGEDVFWLNSTSPVHDYLTTQWFGVSVLPR